MDSRTELVPVQLNDGTKAYIEATPMAGEEEVAFNIMPFEDITDAIESIARAVMASLQKIEPKKINVEFGLSVGLESGKLTTLLVKGTSTANLKITLEWSKETKPQERGASGGAGSD